MTRRPGRRRRRCRWSPDHQATLHRGWPAFMALVSDCPILGLAICVERIIYPEHGQHQHQQAAQQRGGRPEVRWFLTRPRRSAATPAAPWPASSLPGSGPRPRRRGEIVEKSAIAYGGVEGPHGARSSWISLFIALAPMLGFMGTGDRDDRGLRPHRRSEQHLARHRGRRYQDALLTTVFGPITAIIPRIFYNHIQSKASKASPARWRSRPSVWRTCS